MGDAAVWTLTDIGKAIGVVIIALIAISIPAGIIALVIAGGDDIEGDPAALTVAIGASLFLELALLATAVHFSARKYGLSLTALGLRWPQRGGFWVTLGLGIGLVIAGLGINFAYFVGLSAIGIEPDTDLPEEAYQNAGPLITVALLSLVFAPLMEEIFFRGFVFGGLRARWGVGSAALASGALFALLHIGNPGTIYLLPPVAAIGAIFALGYAYSGSLAVSL
ncbi:MAG TPA: type II CAAX endopeptidase family protein, partial [Dehalococcoidia bacterium]|nr:type II CAAX endopeptidase family protein [Dehalococcoidia bacterium]